MTISIKTFRLDDARHLQPCDLDIALDTSEGSPCWIDLQFGHRDEVRDVLNQLPLHPLAVDACLDESPASRVAAYGNSLVLTLPLHSHWRDETRTFLIAVCLPGLLLTIHSQSIPALNHVMEQYADGMRFHGSTTSAILYQVLDHIIDQDVAMTLLTRKEVDALEDLLDVNDDEAIARTVPLKRQLSRLAASFEDQLYCVGSLQTIESSAFHIDGLRDYFRDAFSHLEHASRAIARQQSHLNAIQQGYQLKMQDKTNDQLRLLTVISTIFIPLTLITGIYGMNFRYMPELQWRYGYFGTLGTMVVIACGMLWGFYRAGWFR